MTDPAPPSPLTPSLRMLREQSKEELDKLKREIDELASQLATKSALYGKLYAQHLLSEAQNT